MLPTYRLRLFLPDLCFALAETSAVLWPIYVFITVTRRLVLGTALLFLVGALIWGAVLHRWLLPLDALNGHPAQRRTRAGKEAARRSYRLPWRSLWLRFTMVLLGALLLGIFAVLRLGYPWQTVLVALWSAAIYTPLIDSFRALLFQRLLRDIHLPPQAPQGSDELVYLSETLLGQLTMVALGTGAPAMATVLAVARFFVPLSPAQGMNLQVYYPPVPIVFLLLWGAWLVYRTRPLVRYLRRPVGVAQHDLGGLYRTAQLLPYLLGLSKVVLWALAALSWWLLGTRLWRIDSESNVLLLGLTVLVTLGAALYEVLWHRATLAPLLTHLATGLRGIPPVRAPLSLRSKMLLSFGTLTLFACGLSLFWSAIQYRSVAVRYTRWLNRGRIDDLAAELRVGPATLQAVLRKVQSHARDEALVYYLDPDRLRHRFAPRPVELDTDGPQRGGAPVLEEPPDLPKEAWAALSRREQGTWIWWRRSCRRATRRSWASRRHPGHRQSTWGQCWWRSRPRRTRRWTLIRGS